MAAEVDDGFGQWTRRTEASCAAPNPRRDRARSHNRVTRMIPRSLSATKEWLHMAHIRNDGTLMEAFAMSKADPRPFPVLDPASVEPRRGAAYPEHLRGPFAGAR